MSYAIFRSQPINTLQDLAQIGSHNKREKKAYKSNPNIKLDRSKDNIELVKCDEKYVKRFYELTKDYKKEHEERQKTIREDRKKSYYKMLNDARNVVADELLFTSDSLFFKDKSKEEILRWANTCMEFVYNDLGYTKEQVLHSTIHMDEKTPEEIKYHYDNNYYNDLDLCYISKGTTKEREIFEHIGYIRQSYSKEKFDDFEISR